MIRTHSFLRLAVWQRRALSLKVRRDVEGASVVWNLFSC